MKPIPGVVSVVLLGITWQGRHIFLRRGRQQGIAGRTSCYSIPASRALEEGAVEAGVHEEVFGVKVFSAKKICSIPKIQYLCIKMIKRDTDGHRVVQKSPPA